jgi:hypothetical protein
MRRELEIVLSGLAGRKSGLSAFLGLPAQLQGRPIQLAAKNSGILLS